MDPQLARKNRRMLAGCVLAVGCMIGLSFAAVPLYDLFCRVTGYGGTTQVSATAPGEVLDRVITVRFDASTNVALPWRFSPEQRSVDVRVGESAMAFYAAENPTDTRTVGTATFNVTPLKAGQYFTKVECFCFTEQVLEPGQRVAMPVSFYVDPAIAEDRNLDDVDTITLSYTFFPMEVEEDTSGAGSTAASGQPAPVN
ncbi:MAG: cytochrome c oxidase assembly protein [Alphaproteobacteria bacterium]|nr:cytochrome c oxidase assembly protein [Alphaproteobacteria bacterium]